MIFQEKPLLRNNLKEKRHLFIKRMGPLLLEKYASSYIDFFLKALPLEPLSVIGGYFPLKDEVDCMPLLKTLFKLQMVCALPSITAPQMPLTFRKWAPTDSLKMCSIFSSNLGLKEPLNSSPSVIPHILLVPTLGFDMQGHRIGYGGGFYDRTLKFLRTHASPCPIFVGVSFSSQKIDQLPHEPHDEKLDWILTEERMHKIGSMDKNFNEAK